LFVHNSNKKNYQKDFYENNLDLPETPNSYNKYEENNLNLENSNKKKKVENSFFNEDENDNFDKENFKNPHFTFLNGNNFKRRILKLLFKKCRQIC